MQKGEPVMNELDKLIIEASTLTEKFYIDNDHAVWGQVQKRPEAARPSGNTAVEMFSNALRDMQAVIDLGGRKHGWGSWQDPDNPSLIHKANCASMFRHAAEVSCGIENDPESGVDPLLHLAFRALARYERKARGISDA